ncbi:MAG: TatD family hydrolase [bacterium]
MLIDSHCHLDHLDPALFDGDIANAVSFAAERGVSQILTVGVDLDASRKLIGLAESLPGVTASIGVHPLQKSYPPVPDVDELTALANRPSVVAIGETGLDYYYDKDHVDWQHASFINHLKASSITGKPVIVHTRNARQETLDILDGHMNRDVGGVLHCFTESLEMAQTAVAMGMFISFSGIITFKNAEELREVVRRIPLENMLVETDAPWLAPVPYRGKKNQPAYVVEVAQAVADLKGISFEQVAAQTTENFNRLFGVTH